MRDFFKLFRRYIEGEQTEVSWNKIEPLPDEVVSTYNILWLIFEGCATLKISFTIFQSFQQILKNFITFQSLFHIYL